ncbi:hypothetical protein O3P69_018127 [Scylla paramamosain]|uniref:Uncharacterized protein n=1 Tax=Scylla paramamosain TaxID=85552 RepID=A0AAW0TIW7_SCYPA
MAAGYPRPPSPLEQETKLARASGEITSPVVTPFPMTGAWLPQSTLPPHQQSSFLIVPPLHPGLVPGCLSPHYHHTNVTCKRKKRKLIL